MIPVRECPGVDPQADGTCGRCGNRVAQYFRAAIGHRRWEHKRGTEAGSPKAANAGVAASAARKASFQRQSARVVELEAALAHERDIMTLLRAIESKVDHLLARPIGGEWKPNHRRLADGGEPVRRQRKRARAAAETAPNDWRQQRPTRPKPVPA